MIIATVFYQNIMGWGSPHGVMDNMLDYDIVVHGFNLQSCYFVHFQTDTLRKGINFINSPAMD